MERGRIQIHRDRQSSQKELRQEKLHRAAELVRRQRRHYEEDEEVKKPREIGLGGSGGPRGSKAAVKGFGGPRGSCPCNRGAMASRALGAWDEGETSRSGALGTGETSARGREAEGEVEAGTRGGCCSSCVGFDDFRAGAAAPLPHAARLAPAPPRCRPFAWGGQSGGREQ